MQDLNEIIKEIRLQKKFYSDLKLKLKSEIAALPKGSIQKRIIKNHPYYYLQYRNKGKITHDYLGKKIKPEFVEQVKIRQKYEADIRPINEKLKLLKKFKV
ncbi:MAG: hypothetical protein ABIH89_07265 [Elusimicrobiota bacterium]